MSEKHTKGPWVAAAQPSSIVGWPVVAQSGRLVCSMATPPKDVNRTGKAKEEYDAFMAECAANAELIAAAPDLLAESKALIMVLWAVVNRLDGQAKSSTLLRMNALKAAIAKAGGSQDA